MKENLQNNEFQFIFDNTGYTITTAEYTETGALKIETHFKTGKEMLADWGY
jgi:hypothetical protein